MSFVFKFSCIVIMVLVLSSCILPGFGAHFHIKNIERHTRSIDEMEIVTEKQMEESTDRLVDDGTCLGSNPCGWGAYDERTKKIIYYIDNNCICRSDSKCLRSDYSLSIGSYVYRCR